MEQNYPYLPAGKRIMYVPVSDRFMSEAKNLRDNHSTDFQHPTGAVVVLDGEIVGRAANKSALRSRKLIEFHKNKFCVRRFLKIPSGKLYWLCPGCAKCKHHAEARAVKDATKKGFKTVGADLYLYGHWWCCEPCWDAMIRSGIRDVYLVDDARTLFEAKR